MTDPFELESELGRGGMGVVWRARDAQSGQHVAVKLMHEQFAHDPDYVARLQREVEVSRRIQSPHVVGVLGYGVRGEIPYMVMELVSGPSLKEVIRERGPLPWAQAKMMLRQVAEALDAASRVGVVHRDVKPSNILVTADGSVKLADFGIARALDMTRLTRSSTMMGTPHYMAPEGQRDLRSDLYSLGCVLYEMLTGVPPFEGESQHDIILSHLRAVPYLSGLPEGQPRMLVSWLLQKDPANRPANAAALIAAIDGSTRIPSHPFGVRRRRLVPILAAGLAPLVLIGAAAGVFFAARGGGGSESGVVAAASPGSTATAIATSPPENGGAVTRTSTAVRTTANTTSTPTRAATAAKPTSTPIRGGERQPDGDNDGVADSLDNCRAVSNGDQRDADRDGTGDACDSFDNSDSDGDGVQNGSDSCPGTYARTSNGCTADRDHDGVADSSDNCPDSSNSGQQDSDGDGRGDACDSTDSRDSDGDGVSNSSDSCPNVYARTTNGCVADRDQDGAPDGSDNCPDNSNAGQQDADGDGRGDACDNFDNRDSDGDGVQNGSDSCPNSYGNTSDGCPVSDRDNDGVPDSSDQCPDAAGSSNGCPSYHLDVSLSSYQFSPGDEVQVCYSLSPNTPFALYFYKSVDGGPATLLLSLNDDGYGDCFSAVMGADGQREYTIHASINGSIVATRTLHAQVGPGAVFWSVS